MRRIEPAGLFLCAMLAVTWAWWAWQQGAYFGVVLLPGGVVLCIGVVLLACFAPWRVSFRRSRAAGVALGALLALGAWTAISAIWSPAPAAAIADGQQVLLYGVAFGLGLWLRDLLAPRPQFALVPLAIAGAFAGGAVVITLLMGDHPDDYLYFGNVQYPLGYRNANAAFFLIASFPALGLAADRELDWRIRGVALGAATLCFDVALLSQSRGSIPAGIVALAVYALASPLRLRAISWLLLAAIPAVGVLPAANDLFRTVTDHGPEGALDQLRAAGVAMALTAAAAAIVGAAAARFERRLPGLGSVTRRGNRAVLAGMVGLVVVALAGFVIKVGDPVDWLGKRAEEFRRGGAPDVSQSSSRFVLNLQSDRRDLWTVALDDFSEHPVRGDGGGGFQYTYARKREAEQDARDAHSIELEVLAELGGVGETMLLLALGCMGFALLRARWLGGPGAGIAAIAMASGAYWLVHGSIDWFFHYPALTAPTLALLGSACATEAAAEPRSGRAGRILVVGCGVVLAISLVPPFLSERYVNDAYGEWHTDLERAYDDLDRAASLNRLSDTPPLAEGAIAQAAGDRQHAIHALRTAADRVPDEWATHYLLAELYASRDPQQARRELKRARELNPLGPEIDRLAQALPNPRAVERVVREQIAGEPAP
jgi:tetratricopeptide (TPR) repeat protein